MQDRQRKKMLRILAWSTVGAVIIGLALGIPLVIQPLMERDLWGRKGFSHEPFMLWYPKESPQMASHEELGNKLIDVLQDARSELLIEPSQVPERIDVFVHDDVGQLMSLLSRRKGQDRMNAKAPVDLLAGEDPAKAMAELLLNHVWDTCQSQIVYEGLLQCIAYPEQNFYAPAAAIIGSRKFSLESLLELERGGAYPLTFYQQWVSPSSARFVFALTDIANYYAVPETLLSESTQDLPTLLAASLVQTILALGDGIVPLKEAWRLPNTESILESASGLSLNELDSQWRQLAQTEGELSDDFRLWQASFLIHSGDYAAALDLLSGQDYALLEPALLETALTAALLQPDLHIAGQLLDLPQCDSLPPSLLEWAHSVVSMSHLPLGNTLYISSSLPEGELLRLAQSFNQAYDAAVSSLALDESTIPLPIRVFVYQDEEQKRQAEKLLHPPMGDLPSIHLTMDETGVADFSSRIVSRFWDSSDSNMLTSGLGQWLTLSKEEIVQQACSAQEDGDWLGWLRLMAQSSDSPIVTIAMGLYVSCLIDLYGTEPLAALWHRTTMWGGGHSFKGAMSLVDAVRFKALEDAVDQALQSCSPIVE
jgi:hypothetical protein